MLRVKNCASLLARQQINGSRPQRRRYSGIEQTQQTSPHLYVGNIRPTRPGPLDPAPLKRHLDQLFQPLNFPPDLAARVLTHASHVDALHRHNARMSFIGRRVLNTYIMLFLQSSPHLVEPDFNVLAERALNTYVLGEYVAPHWSLGSILRWTPVKNGGLPDRRGPNFSELLPDVSLSIGLYKVQGTAVEAVIGGVFHQFGGSVAHRLFHTRIIPHLLLPGRREGLLDSLHEHAMKVCQDMGGPEGPLI